MLFEICQGYSHVCVIRPLKLSQREVKSLPFLVSIGVKYRKICLVGIGQPYFSILETSKSWYAFPILDTRSRVRV